MIGFCESFSCILLNLKPIADKLQALLKKIFELKTFSVKFLILNENSLLNFVSKFIFIGDYKVIDISKIHIEFQIYSFCVNMQLDM